MAFTQILYNVTAGVASITLNRPERLNAWTQTMEREVRAALSSAAQDDAARVIVLTGAGRGFCGGADVDDLSAAMAGADVRTETAYPAGGATGIDANYDKRFSYMLRVPKPIIAAINGSVAGVGLCVAMFCDIRFIAQGAKVTTIFAERGLIAEHGSAWMLPRLIGPMNALTMFYSCKPIDSVGAAQLGLARLLPAEGFLESVHEFATLIASRSSPRSLRIIKRQVYDGLFQTLAESGDIGDEEMFESFESEDFREGVAHYLERRLAKFTGR